MNNLDKNEKALDTQMISLISAAGAGIYQYNLLLKSNPNYSMKIRLAYCSGAALISYFMTRTLLNNFNNIN